MKLYERWFKEDVNKNIEEDNIEKNNDEKASDSFLKIDPIKSLDSSNIKIEMPKKWSV